MAALIKNYLFDFWLWWYWFNLRRVAGDLYKNWNFTIGYLNLVPMAKNLFRPMFQDYSWEGKLVAIPFRLTWVFFGAIILLGYTCILIVVLAIYLILPMLPVLVLITSLYSR